MDTNDTKAAGMDRTGELPVERRAVERRALASQPAAPVQPVEQVQGMTELQKFQIVAGCATDDLVQIHCALGFPEDQTIDAEDMIEAIRELQAATGTAPADAAPPVQQPGDVRDHEYSDLVTTLRQLSEAYPVEIWPELTEAQRDEMGVLLDRASAAMGRTMGKTFTRAADAIEALATTRPSSALTEDEQNELLCKVEDYMSITDRFSQTHADSVKVESEIYAMVNGFISARLAASSGAVAVPEGWIAVEDRLPEENAEVIITGPAYGDYAKGRYSSKATFSQGIFFNEDGDDMHDPSHWCVIPAAPATPAQGQTK